MSRRAAFSWGVYWREQYAHGEITLEQFEALIEAWLREPPRREGKRGGVRTAKEAAEAWSAAATRAAQNYQAGVSAWRADSAARG